MKKSTSAILLLLLLYSSSVIADPENRSFQLTSPKLGISDIPLTLQIQALTDGTVDSTFSDSLLISGAWKGEAAVHIKFKEGEAVLPDIIFQKAGHQTITLTQGDQTVELSLLIIPGILSLLPPILAIVLALLFRQVLISLFAGILLGTTILTGYNPFLGLLRLLDTYIVGSLAQSSHASILIFSLMLGGMVGIISRSGGTHGIVQKLTRFTGKPKGGLLATWAMGVFIFFDDYANTLIVGNTMRPITDKLKISREKLSYIVDATAAPVCSVAIISTWIGFELGLVQATFDFLGISRNIYFTYLQTIPYRFYSIFTIIFVLTNALTNRDFGPMLKAERRARKTGEILREGSMPLSDPSLTHMSAPDGSPLRWYNAFIPIAVVIFGTMLGLYYSGYQSLISQGIADPNFKAIIGSADSFSVLMWSSFLGVFIAAILAISQKIINLRQTVDAWLGGMKAMFYAMIILVFAWTIGRICEELHTADYVISVTRDFLSPNLLPLITFLLAALISFATGTSWGTMSILVPIVIPMAHQFTQQSGLAPEIAESILIGTIASVLSGAVFGDHCSPISDTTIMSSMASGADHVDHVRTQIPYAVLVGFVAMAVGYLPAGFGFNPLISIPLGSALLIGFLYIFGRKPSIK